MLEDSKNYYIISEILEGGELFERLVNVKFFSERKAAKILK